MTGSHEITADQLGRRCGVSDQQVEGTVAIVIKGNERFGLAVGDQPNRRRIVDPGSTRRTPPHSGCTNGKEVCGSRVSWAGRRTTGIRIPVDRHQVAPTIVVEVLAGGSPSPGRLSNAKFVGGIDEPPVPTTQVKPVSATTDGYLPVDAATSFGPGAIDVMNQSMVPS